MSDPLTSNQHGYIKRALLAFETVAESLKRIAAALEAQSGDNDTSNVWMERSITEIRSGSRYDVLDIEGVEKQSVAIDYGQNPPQLRIWAADVHQPTTENQEHPTHVVELSAAKSSDGEN